MINANTTAPEAEATVTETTVVTETTLGPIGRFFRMIRKNPVESILATGVIATGGFFAYTKLIDGDLESAAEDVVEVAAAIRSLAA